MARFSSSGAQACFSTHPSALPGRPLQLCSPAVDFPGTSATPPCPLRLPLPSCPGSTCVCGHLTPMFAVISGGVSWVLFSFFHVFSCYRKHLSNTPESISLTSPSRWVWPQQPPCPAGHPLGPLLNHIIFSVPSFRTPSLSTVVGGRGGLNPYFWAPVPYPVLPSLVCKEDADWLVFFSP